MSLYTVVFICNDHLNLQCLRLMIHVCTDHKQVEELHLKNQLNRGYNKLQKKKKSYKKINKAFLFNKVFKKLDHSKVFVQFISMMTHVFLIIYVFLCIMVKKRYNVYTFVKIR
jgi:hypothetical protein